MFCMYYLFCFHPTRLATLIFFFFFFGGGGGGLVFVFSFVKCCSKLLNVVVTMH